MELYYKLFLSLGLSLLIGLEREFERQVRKVKTLFGIRSATLLGLLSALFYYLSNFTSIQFSFSLGLIVTLVIATSSYFLRYKKLHLIGITSYIAFIIIYISSFLIFLGEYFFPIAIGIITVLLLASFQELHGFARKIKKHEFFAFLKFLVISIVLLPLIPSYYVIDDLSLFDFWKIVVIFSSIQLLIYLLKERFKKAIAAIFLSSMINSESSMAVIKKYRNPSFLFLIASSLSLSQLFLFPIIIVNKDLLLLLFEILILSIAYFCLFYKFRKERKIKVKLKPLSITNAIKFALLFFVAYLFALKLSPAISFIFGIISATSTIASLLLLYKSGMISLYQLYQFTLAAIALAIVNKFFFGFEKDKEYIKKFVNYMLISLFILLLFVVTNKVLYSFGFFKMC